MPDETDRAFDAETVWDWQTTMRERIPDTPLKGREVPGLDVVSFSTAAAGDAFAVRLSARDGSEVDVVTNPVAAVALARAIVEAGRMAGWLDEDGDISFPPADRRRT